MGATVDLDIPRSFWSRLAGKYGNMFYWKEKVKSLCPVVMRSIIYFSCLEEFADQIVVFKREKMQLLNPLSWPYRLA